jgi:hypothetical protein
MAGPPGEARLGIPYGAATPEEGRQHVRELLARKVHFVKFWVDDRDGTVPKLKSEVYRAIIDEAHKHGMETLAHLSRTSGLADAKVVGKRDANCVKARSNDKEPQVDDHAVVSLNHLPTGMAFKRPGTLIDNDAVLLEGYFCILVPKIFDKQLCVCGLL